MAVQQSDMGDFFQEFGGRLAGANEQHRDKPIDTGIQRLPGGIKDGIAKLDTAQWGIYESDRQGVKGKRFFRFSAAVVWPKEFNGMNTSSMHTSQIIPMCDVPAKGEFEGASLEDNFFTFQNMFKLLSNGVIVCPETRQTDPTGQRTMAFFNAAAKQLTDPQRPQGPVYITFSTVERKSKQRRGESDKEYAERKPFVYENWHGLATPEQIAKINEMANPVNAVTVRHTQPSPHEPPPDTKPQLPAETAVDGLSLNPEDEVASLVEVAMSDPEQKTPDGRAACKRLEDMAWKRGWTREQTTGAADWAAVGEMALNDSPREDSHSDNGNGKVTVGSQWMFTKRAQDGSKLKNKGVELPAHRVEVLTIDEANNTCTVKTTKDGKEIVNIGNKKPTNIRLEWLEPIQ